ncbi:MAG: MFS transporter [Boseongicola sp.]|nr:MAG: MFS transporter [Boseongicola sp.]
MQASTARNLTLYPWFKLFQNLLFWQAIWFLFFQQTLSAADAILLYAVYDLSTTALEVPSGFMSDRLGRKITLVASAIMAFVGTLFFVFGASFPSFVLGQILLGASSAFVSGTDSSILYESLAAEERSSEVEAHELRAWRFNFSGLAISAVTGGVFALWSFVLPFAVSAVAMAIAILVAFQFAEPPRAIRDGGLKKGITILASLRAAFVQPVLVWLFILSVLMYTFSHIPFVFGQPFILEAMDRFGLAAEAPLFSGVVTSIMMVVSVAVSLIAPRLRTLLGLPLLLLIAFGLQIAIAAVLAMTNATAAIAILFLRMVPSSLSGPFILARIQPLLRNETRASYLSFQSLCGRLAFASSLWVASSTASEIGNLVHADISRILGWYVVAGLICLLALSVGLMFATIEQKGTGEIPKQ